MPISKSSLLLMPMEIWYLHSNCYNDSFNCKVYHYFEHVSSKLPTTGCNLFKQHTRITVPEQLVNTH